ncbi:phosphatase PAP2 family protein [Haloarchaeobius amylolyticus]|uniref:Phosphatase PAP2 family protein n=1 Tax=Haloarchaeobius amylolyticus TaxID=1198296 RepID=A0ABD6BFF1_9EURY
MSRGLDWFDSFRSVAPEWSVVLLGLVTQLGDVWFLGLLVGTVYWAATPARRDGAAAVLGLTLAGLSLITGLKDVFALSRPERVLVAVEALPEAVHPLYRATATATGYGFPSGHALMTTIVYLSLAEYLSVGTRRQRYLAAAGIVTAVSFSRVALGVHYLVDVGAGVVAGLAFLALAAVLLSRVPDHRGTIGFALAVVVAVLSLVPARTNPDAVLLFGASLGAFAGWQLAALVRDLEAGAGPIRSSRSLTARATVATLVVVALGALSVTYWTAPVIAGSGLLGLAAAAFVAAPALYRSDHVGGLGGRSPVRSQ